MVNHGKPNNGSHNHAQYHHKWEPYKPSPIAKIICLRRGRAIVVFFFGVTRWRALILQNICKLVLKLLNSCGYGSIPINTIFSGMNIHLPAILMFTRGTRFWHIAMQVTRVTIPWLKNITFEAAGHFDISFPPLHPWLGCPRRKHRRWARGGAAGYQGYQELSENDWTNSWNNMSSFIHISHLISFWMMD